MTNQLDVLRKSVDDYREMLQAGGPLGDAEFADEYAALADVGRLVEAAREYAYAQGLNTEPFGDDEEYREEILRNHGEEAAALVEALARFPKPEGEA